MIGIVKLEALKDVAAAVRRAQSWSEAWWEIAEVEDVLRLGQRLGWLFRLSTTQVHWTGAGAGAFREFLEGTSLAAGAGELLVGSAMLHLVGTVDDVEADEARRNTPHPPGESRERRLDRGVPRACEVAS